MKKLLFGTVLFALLFSVACANSNNDSFVDVNIASYRDNVHYATYVNSESASGSGEDGEITIYQSNDELIFDSIDEMIDFGSSSGIWRNEIVRAEVLDERVEMHNTTAVWQHEDAQYFLGEDPGWDHSDDYIPVTLYRIRVLEVFLGDVQVGDIIEIRQPGGEVGNVRMVNESFVPLMLGDDLILFLASIIWMPNSPAGLMSSTQAAYRFPAVSDGARSVSFDEVLEPVHQFPEDMAEYALPLTVEDLANFQIENFGQVSESFETILR